PAMPAPITTISLYSAIKSLLWRDAPPGRILLSFIISIVSPFWPVLSVAAATGLAAARCIGYTGRDKRNLLPRLYQVCPGLAIAAALCRGRLCPDAKKG